MIVKIYIFDFKYLNLMGIIPIPILKIPNYSSGIKMNFFFIYQKSILFRIKIFKVMLIK